MPQVTAATILQLTLLVSAIPAQYLISRWTGASSVERYHATKRLLGVWNEWWNSYVNSTFWKDLASSMGTKVMTKVTVLVGGEEEEEVEVEEGESPALEVMLIDNDMGFFGASKVARRPRPTYVFLRVGDVVMERAGPLVGVVVSWDPELRAPPEWIDRVYSNSEDAEAKNTPHYKVLFSGPAGPDSIMVGYVPQTKLVRITDTKPDIPTLDHYFSHFDGERFVMQPWLQEIYPDD